MGLFRDLFYASEFDEAKRLMNLGNYQECIKHVLANRSLLEPGSVMVERTWYIALCDYKMGDYNRALSYLTDIIDDPDDSDSDIKRLKRLARDLRATIHEEQRRLGNSIVYPTSPFFEFVAKRKNMEEGHEIAYEGISLDFEYYIRNTFCFADYPDAYTVYLKPINQNQIEIFVYFDFIERIYKLKEDDSINYYVVTSKLPKIKRLIENGKDGANYNCSIYTTIDYHRPHYYAYRIPVLGLSRKVENATNCELENFEQELEIIFAVINEIVLEIANCEYGFGDMIKAGFIAMLGGAAKKVATEELAKPAMTAIKHFFKH